MKNFNTYISEKLKITKHMLNNQRYGYEYVDLGLSSGTLWAKCNVGAKTETEYGGYFAWGETETKKNYDWDTYKYCDGNFNALIKYCSGESFGHKGFIDNITQLEPEDDAVHVNMGGKWYIPTKEQFEELIDNTTHKLVENYNNSGVNGVLFTSKENGNTLFFPAAGYIDGSSPAKITINDVFYWSSNISPDYPYAAYDMCLTNRKCCISEFGRWGGLLARGVLKK